MKRAKGSQTKLAKKAISVPPEGALVVTVDQAAVMLALGRVSIYKMLREGALEGRLFGRARRITRASIDRLVGAA
jgi:excisionase family DNA binding protein